MKRAVFISVFANLVLAVFLLRRAALPGEPPGAVSPSRGQDAQTVQSVTNVIEVIQVVTNAAPPFTWDLVESEDYSEYMTGLRRLGCPEWLVRGLILLELERHYDERERTEARGEPGYWLTHRERLARNREQAEKTEALWLEERDVMRQLTGTYRHEEARELARDDEMTWVLGVLPHETACEAVSQLVLQHELKESYDDRVGLITPYDRLRLQSQFAAVRQAVGGLAAPAAMEEFWLRLQVFIGGFGDDLDFPGLQLTGAQFRELIRIRSQFIDPIEREFTDAKEPEGPELARLESEVQLALTASLGDKLAADYARSRDPAFRSIHEFTGQHQLPIESAVFIYDVRQAAISEIRFVALDPALDPARSYEHRQMVQRETEELLFDALGAETFLAYKEGQGAWLNRIGGRSPGRRHGTGTVNWRRVLIFSLGLNLVLAAVWLKNRTQPARDDAPTTTTRSEPAAVAGPLVVAVTNVQRTTAPFTNQTVWPAWEQLAGDDLFQQRTNLLAVECPPATVHDILVLTIDHLRVEARAAFMAPHLPRFWDLLAAGGVDDNAEMERINSLLEEHLRPWDDAERVLEGLHGGDRTDAVALEHEPAGPAYGHLPEEKQRQVAALLQKLDADVGRTLEEHREDDRVTAAGLARAQALREEFQTEMNALLTAEELLELRLRESGSSTWAANLRGFEPAPEELGEIALWRLEFNEQHHLSDQNSEEFEERLAARQAAEGALNDRIRDLLGDERYAQLERAQDEHYQSLYDVGLRFEMSEVTVNDAWRMQQEARAAAQRIRDDPALTAGQRRNALLAIQQETRSTFQTLLGDEAYQTYLENGGDWLGELGRNPRR